MSDELLTIPDVARALKCSTRTVRRAIDDRGLRAFQVAGRGSWRIRRDDLNAWLEQRANTSQPVARRAPAVAPVLAAAHPLHGRRRRGTGVLTVGPTMGRKTA